jgi:hypothetical protein
MHDCREGICGTCGMMINGQAHGPQLGTATCQLHMRTFSDGDEIVIEPWRATGLPHHQGPRGRPGLRSTTSSRPAATSALDTGSASDANLTPGARSDDADLAMDAAACIGVRSVRRGLPERGGATVHRSEDRPPQHPAAGPGGAVPAHRAHGRGHGGALRLLHQHGRVRGGLPEGHLDRLHRDDEQGLPQGECSRTVAPPDTAARTHDPRTPRPAGSSHVRSGRHRREVP